MSRTSFLDKPLTEVGSLIPSAKTVIEHDTNIRLPKVEANSYLLTVKPILYQTLIILYGTVRQQKGKAGRARGGRGRGSGRG